MHSHLHAEPLVLSLSLFLGMALTSSGALAGPDNSSFSTNTMKGSIGLKRSREKEASFLKALNDHQGILFRICKLYCNRPGEEQDLFQEIAYSLWRSYPSFRGQSSVSSWMYSIAMRTAMMPHRKRRVKVEYGKINPSAALVEGPNDQGEAQEFLRSLDKENRTIVMMMADGYTRKEISAIAGISEEAVTMRMSRLRNSLNSSRLFKG